MFKLRSKTAHLSTSINTRTQRKGEEREPYLDIPLTLSITARELNVIMGEPHTADAWFETKDGKPDEPLLKHLAPYRLKAKFENSIAEFSVGLKGEKIDCGNCTLNKLVFEPLSDGRTALKLKVQCAATVDSVKLIFWMDHDVDVVLQFGEMVGDEAQEELPLEVADDDAPSLSAPQSESAPALN